MQLQMALRKLASVFRFTRGPGKANAREIPQATVEKYHRAMWAIDVLGPTAVGDRWALREMWQNATHVAANADGVDGAAIAQDLIGVLNEQCERVIRQCEKDVNRAMWEKQRDFLVGSLRRVRRAAALGDTDHLHFYKKGNEVFNVDLKHEVFQIGYQLWQGLREEMKAAITLALYSERPNHVMVEYLLTSMRKIIRAMEYADLSGFEHFDPRDSKLHFSQEQQGQMLWEAVREEIARVIARTEARDAA